MFLYIFFRFLVSRHWHGMVTRRRKGQVAVMKMIMYDVEIPCTETSQLIGVVLFLRASAYMCIYIDIHINTPRDMLTTLLIFSYSLMFCY